MARGVITATRISLDGITLPADTTGNATDGHVTDNDGDRVLVRVTNTSDTTAYDVTFRTPGNVGGFAIEDKVEEIAAEAEVWFGPFPLSVFSNDLQIDVENAALHLLVVKV